MKTLKTKRSAQIKNYLIDNYSLKSKEEIVKELGLSWGYIQKMAHLFNIKREFNESKKSFKLSKLLDDSNISYYWIGFIIADGHISKYNNIQINLNKKDINHLNKLKIYLQSDIKLHIKGNIVRSTFTDVPTIIKLKNKFKWKSNKTKSPVDISNLNEEQLFSLIIGFIDGDGSINSKSITVKCDKKWKDTLNYFYYCLIGEYKEFNYVDNCSIFYINKHEYLKSIKIKALSLSLPIMERKWDKINLNKIMKYEKSDIVYDLLSKGKSVNDIKEMGFSISLIYSVKNKILEMRRKDF